MTDENENCSERSYCSCCKEDSMNRRGRFTISFDGPVGFISIDAYSCTKCGRVQFFEPMG